MIKQISLLQLTQEEEKQLRAGARLHHRMSNITFKVINATNEAITIRTTQGRHMSGNYANVKTLVTRTKELFSIVIKNQIIHTHPVPYQVTPINPKK